MPPLDAVLDIAIIVLYPICAVAIDCDHCACVVMARPPTSFFPGLLVRVKACLDLRPDGKRLLGRLLGGIGVNIHGKRLLGRLLGGRLGGGGEGCWTGRAF